MSGFKYSTADVKKEREEAINLLNQIREARAGLRALRTRIRETLDRTPRGIKDIFKKEIARAEEWLENSPPEGTEENGEHYPRYGWRDGYLGTELALAVYGSIENLRKVGARLSALVEQGMEVQAALVATLNQKADAMEQALVLRLVQLQAQSEGSQELLHAWFPAGLTRELDSLLKTVSYDLANFQIQEGSLHLQTAENKLDACLREARDMEYKHQKRLFVLKCLRQVCREMGFEESEPRYEGGDVDRRRNIVYQVDTLDQGTVVFYLSLEGVETRSAIAEDRCLDEFAEISRSLESQFGIKTRFAPEGERPDDKLRHKGELDLPEGRQIARPL